VNLAVPIHGHEPEGRIDGVVDDGEVQPVAFGTIRDTISRALFLSSAGTTYHGA
jgi:hypothetical protein